MPEYKQRYKKLSQRRENLQKGQQILLSGKKRRWIYFINGLWKMCHKKITYKRTASRCVSVLAWVGACILFFVFPSIGWFEKKSLTYISWRWTTRREKGSTQKIKVYCAISYNMQSPFSFLFCDSGQAIGRLVRHLLDVVGLLYVFIKWG